MGGIKGCGRVAGAGVGFGEAGQRQGDVFVERQDGRFPAVSLRGCRGRKL